MVHSCCAFNCTNASDKNPELIFHLFPNPEKDEERWLKWIHVIKRKNWQPTKCTKLCSAHFLPTDYEPPVCSGPFHLKKDAVPSIFNYPDYLLPRKVTEKRPLVRITPNVSNIIIEDLENCTIIAPVKEEPLYKSAAVQTKLTGIELVKTLNDLRHDKKILQQQLKRRNHRVVNQIKSKNI